MPSKEFNSLPNIYLVGPMGAGKTTVGRHLAELLGREFLDSDHEIERKTGATIPWIFEKEGETGFRTRETIVIDELTARPHLVLATGGGAVTQAPNRNFLKQRGIVFISILLLKFNFSVLIAIKTVLSYRLKILSKNCVIYLRFVILYIGMWLIILLKPIKVPHEILHIKS